MLSDVFRLDLQICFIDRLPAPELNMILSYLSAADLCRMAAQSRRYYVAATADGLWKPIFQSYSHDMVLKAEHDQPDGFYERTHSMFLASPLPPGANPGLLWRNPDVWGFKVERINYMNTRKWRL